MTGSTRASLLREAEVLLRTQGYSAFSYADLAEKLNISKASVHHHFPTKEKLGIALIDEYLADFRQELADIETKEIQSLMKLHLYAQLFIGPLGSRQLPLCGALAAGVHAMPKSLHKKTTVFFELHLEWLARVITAGVAEGALRANLDTMKAAALLLCVLEGASLIGRVYDDSTHLKSAFEMALISLA